MGEISNHHTNTIIDCIQLCETTVSCSAVAFSSDDVGPDATNCQLKAILIGRAINPEPSNGTTLAYLYASTRCEALLAQGRRVQLLGQRDYTLQCNTDTTAEDDIVVTYTGSLNECMALCDRQSACNAVAYRESDQRCSQKSLDKSSNLQASSDVDMAYVTPLELGIAFPDKDQTGAWGPTVAFPIIPVAAALIPNSNKVFVWSADFVDDYTLTKNSSDGRFTYFATMDIVTGEVSEQFVSSTHHNMFCPGISFDPTGRLVVTGGSTDAAVSIYDPDLSDWIAAAPMHVGRGYQSSVLTSTGDIFVLGGSWSGPNETKIGEVYSPKSDIWIELPGCPTAPMETADKKGVYRSDNHAWLFSWKDGAIFQAGPSRAMNWFFVNGSGSYAPAGLRSDAEDSMCGNAVMYDIGQILTVGGSSSYDNSSGHYASQIITLGSDANSPVRVVRASEMVYPRVQANSVVLPSGEVFVTGGQAFSNLFTDYQAILYPEMFDPVTRSFRLLEAMAPVPRTYHSVATLLPDGTVFTGGGGLCGPCRWNHLDANIYEPPYLFRANKYAVRPFIWKITPQPGSSNSSSANEYLAGLSFTVTLSPLVYSMTEHTFALMRVGSVTHSTDTDQRRIPLVPVARSSPSNSTATYTLELPNDYGLMPPGWYMLFAMDDEVPSLARWINIVL
ncbi:hypothetical protein PV11_08673 [Exophiala sideris]|uniref:Apple domain-containing protein n=1 Tax=Exophiala sideris TaxID=1016849 RepID=A0A0D1YE49_9EURO|nr:hypothetical protein PV11_08673 [Exophiala sideris]